MLAASSNNVSNTIPKIVYDNGWAGNGSEKNGQSFYGIKLPLGPDYGGPLFFAHYSFLGINPHGLSDAYANYWEQDTAHAKILICIVSVIQKELWLQQFMLGTYRKRYTSGNRSLQPTMWVLLPDGSHVIITYTPTQSMDTIRLL